MAQFDVYENRNQESRSVFPYLLDVQHTLHERLETRMVIPFTQKLSEVKGLTPSFEIAGEKYVAVVPEMVGVSKEVLGQKVANVSKDSGKIINAIDLLITGF